MNMHPESEGEDEDEDEEETEGKFYIPDDSANYPESDGKYM